MKKNIILHVFIFISILIPESSILLKDKIITLDADGIAMIGSGITIDDAKVFAINDAKRNALEQIGTYLESNTTVINHIVTKDEITTFTGSVLKSEVISTENALSDKMFVLKVKIKVTIDTELLNKRIEDIQKDSELRNMLEEERKRNDFLVIQIEDFKKKVNITEKDIKKITDALSASDWLNKGYNAKELTEQIIYYDKAIELDPKYEQAYNNRGAAFYELKDYTNTISDYSKVIELNPKTKEAYFNRGIVYSVIKNYYKAISDFDKAIENNPGLALAYKNRGILFQEIKQCKDSVDDLNEYLRLSGNSNGDADKVRKWIRDMGYTPKY